VATEASSSSASWARRARDATSVASLHASTANRTRWPFCRIESSLCRTLGKAGPPRVRRWPPRSPNFRRGQARRCRAP
jgi:hypothetical protein